MIGFLAISGVGALLWFAPPLLRSSDYEVRYEIDGKAHSDAELFKPLGMSSRYYVRLPFARNRLYRWIGIDFERGVAAVGFLSEESFWGTPRIDRNDRVGLNLTHGKLQSDWKVSFTPDNVTLTSSGMSVWMEKRVR